MIDTSKATWEFSDQELYAIEWLNEHGFSGYLKKQYKSKTDFIVKRDGIEDIFYVPIRSNYNIKRYMEEYGRSFDLLCKLKEAELEFMKK